VISRLRCRWCRADARPDAGHSNLGFTYVDVRDVADLHLRAMVSPQAAGERFIAASEIPLDGRGRRNSARAFRAARGQGAEARIPISWCAASRCSTGRWLVLKRYRTGASIVREGAARARLEAASAREAIIDCAPEEPAGRKGLCEAALHDSIRFTNAQRSYPPFLDADRAVIKALSEGKSTNDVPLPKAAQLQWK